ncbi:MAG: hypothetical protein ACK53Y_06590, partial [bacterium]
FEKYVWKDLYGGVQESIPPNTPVPWVHQCKPMFLWMQIMLETRLQDDPQYHVVHQCKAMFLWMQIIFWRQDYKMISNRNISIYE